MKGFTRWLDAGGGNLLFAFRPVFTTGGLRYYVTVTDKAWKRYLFHMECRDGLWRIIDAPKVPDWIHKLEKNLHEAIVCYSQ